MADWITDGQDVLVHLRLSGSPSAGDRAAINEKLRALAAQHNVKVEVIQVVQKDSPMHPSAEGSAESDGVKLPDPVGGGD